MKHDGPHREEPCGAHWTGRYRSETLNIADVRCRPGSTACTHDFCFAEHRMAFLRRGRYTKHRGQRSVQADATTVVFFPSEQIFVTSHADIGGDDCTFFSFSDSILEECAHDNGRIYSVRDPFGADHCVMAPPTLLAFRHLRKSLEDGVVSPLEVEEGALALLQTVQETDIAQKPSRTAPTRLAVAAQEAISADPARPLRLGELAASLNTTPFHLSRTFRAALGVTLSRYQTQLRLALALDLIKSGADDLSAVAFECGFSSHAHFTHVFRTRFGIVPSAQKAQ